MLLRFLYLALSTTFAFIRLVPMSDREKDLEILVLRHQVAVQQRTVDRPQLTWPDRALLAALLHRFPRARLRQLRLIVSPDTFLRWHRDLLRRRHAKASRPKRRGRPRASALSGLNSVRLPTPSGFVSSLEFGNDRKLPGPPSSLYLSRIAPQTL
ncbi:hypothetical protein [Streptomyces sp. NPDC056669]|uniref:hypothetical protein n=1 Tax=unclassified Streptomyces TaxID=2593676 RepID=UPI0036B3C4E2